MMTAFEANALLVTRQKNTCRSAKITCCSGAGAMSCHQCHVNDDTIDVQCDACISLRWSLRLTVQNGEWMSDLFNCDGSSEISGCQFWCRMAKFISSISILIATSVYFECKSVTRIMLNRPTANGCFAVLEIL